MTSAHTSPACPSVTVPGARAGRGVRVVLVLLVSTSLFIVAVTGAKPALAFGVSPLPAFLPAGLAGSGVVAGAEAITAASAASLAEASAVVAGTAVAGSTVAIAPVAAAAAAGVAGGAAVYFAWKWATGHDPAYAQKSVHTFVPFGSVPVTFEIVATGTTGQSKAAYTVTPETGQCRESESVNTFPNTCQNQGVVGDPASTELLPYNAKVSCQNVVGDGCNGARAVLLFKAVSVDQRRHVVRTTTQEANGAPLRVLARAICFENLNATGTDLASNCRFDPVRENSWGKRAGEGYWLTLGDPSEVAPAEPDPSAVPVTTTPTRTCRNASSVDRTVTGPPVTYTGATASQDLPVLTLPACASGERTVAASFPSTAGGLAVEPPLKPWSAPIIPSAYGQCNPSGNCQLTLLEISPDGETRVCNGTDACTGWDTLPLLAPTRTVIDTATGLSTAVKVPTRPDGRTYRCMWGPVELKASDCTTVPTMARPGAPAEGDAGSAGSSSCTLQGLSFNPVTWVVVPLKCLFIPSPAGVAKVKTTAATISAAVPFSYVGDVVTWGQTVTVPTDCLKIDFNVPVAWAGFTDGKARVLDMCNPTGRPENVLVEYRGLLQVAVWAMFVLPIAWWAWGAYAPGSAGDA